MNSEYFELVKPTYIENWPRELTRLSIAQTSISLSIEEMDKFSKTLFGSEDEYDAEFIETLADQIQKAIDKFPKGVFIRLGSRSPKDSWVGYSEGFKVTTSKKALSLFVDSERILDDLSLAKHHNYNSHIFIREWIDIPEWTEFRCFMKGRKIVGLSQYQYLNNAYFNEIDFNKDLIEWGIKEKFFPVFKTASHLDDVIFDVFINIKERNNERSIEVKLLEINPFFEMTDPCLFSWEDGGDFDGSFRSIIGE